MATLELRVDGEAEKVLELEIGDSHIRQINEQIARLAERNVNLSLRAYLFSILAIEAIASEPALDWPNSLNEVHSDDADELQSQFINAFGFHLFTMARGQSKGGQITDIQIIESIRHMAQLSWECRCVFRAPRQTPAQ